MKKRPVGRPRMYTDSDTVKLRVVLPREQGGILERYAKAAGLSSSQVARQIIFRAVNAGWLK